MYPDGQKALVMLREPDFIPALSRYLLDRYNLQTEPVSGILDVLNRMSEGNTYELIILDETVAGIPATSHTLIKIKENLIETNALYLSSLMELSAPYRSFEMDVEPELLDPLERLNRINTQNNTRKAMQTPLKGNSFNEVYRLISHQLVESFEADGAICAILKIDEFPVERGLLVEHYPGNTLDFSIFPLAGTGHLSLMNDYYMPVHIPDLNEVPVFQKELSDKMGLHCRSILLLPMQLGGKTIGFCGMYMREEKRLFTISEIDLSQRMADTASAVLASIFFSDIVNIKLNQSNQSIAG